SALAVSNKVENAIAMGVGVTFVLIASSLIISVLRPIIPARVRILAYMIVIASFVIIVDRYLKAFYPKISDALGPYVALIITNCIIMGRAEAFATKNKVHHSILDGLSNGLGYSFSLIAIAAVREVLAFGSLLNYRVMPQEWTNWVVMAMAPGAFFLFGIYVWIMRTLANIKS
ncbi:MAG: Rnf-Nqr domain containing protein, partial [Spirochaetota bacterium]